MGGGLLKKRAIEGNFTQRNWSKSGAKHFECDRYIVHESFDEFLPYNFNPYNLALIELSESVDLSLFENEVLLPCSSSRLSPEIIDPPLNLGYAVGMGLIQMHPPYSSDVLKGIPLIHEPNCAMRSVISQYKFLRFFQKKLMIRLMTKDAVTNAHF